LENRKTKGVIFGIISVFIIGFQPIVANSRPVILDAYLFAAMTVFVEALIFFPLMKLERKKIKLDYKRQLIDSEDYQSLLFGYKKNRTLLICVGIIFGVCQILFFVGYEYSGAINGSLAQKSTIFFSLLFGYIILHEKITAKQILFSCLLLIGLILAVTEGSFNLLELNLGVIILLVLSCLWMLGHTFTKPIFNRNEAIPSQIVVIRSTIGFLILISTYFLFFPLENVHLLLDPINLLWGFAMGAVYGTSLLFWYKTLRELDVNKASILVSPTPIATALYATFLLGEIFTIYHLFGTIIVIFSIIMIFSHFSGKKAKK